MSELRCCILVCTYNRADDLREMLESAVRQQVPQGAALEILVVDNNSSDATRSVAEEFGRRDSRVRYLFEPKQGKSYALNAGIAATTADVFSVVDDDLIMPEDFVSRMHASFAANPWASHVGGKVLPLFAGPVPPWLTPERWAPIAMADYGEEPFRVDSERQICLLSCTFRRAAVQEAGGYRNDLSVNGGAIGGTEDSELLERLWKNGHAGLYDPTLRLFHKVSARRTTRAHFRRWHFGHGRFIARGQQAAAGKFALLGIPGYLMKGAVADATRVAIGTMVPPPDGSHLDAVHRLSFFFGFAAERLKGSRPAALHKRAGYFSDHE